MRKYLEHFLSLSFIQNKSWEMANWYSKRVKWQKPNTISDNQMMSVKKLPLLEPYRRHRLISSLKATKITITIQSIKLTSVPAIFIQAIHPWPTIQTFPSLILSLLISSQFQIPRLRQVKAIGKPFQWEVPLHYTKQGQSKADPLLKVKIIYQGMVWRGLCMLCIRKIILGQSKSMSMCPKWSALSKVLPTILQLFYLPNRLKLISLKGMFQLIQNYMKLLGQLHRKNNIKLFALSLLLTRFRTLTFK